MQRFLVPRRLLLAGAIALGIAVIASAMGGSSVAATHAATPKPLCALHAQLCTEASNPVSYDGYTYASGHDEPSLLFYSNKQGSGNSNKYQLTLPSDPSTPPAQDGSGGTDNFMLHPAFWFGMAMCDNQSAPTPGKACPADSDKNIYTSTNPSSPNYIGKTPGTAFMEMQFYPSGWGNVGTGVSCGPDNTQWCAAMTIDSFSSNSNTGVVNNDSCLNQAGEEYVNYAIITKSGNSQGPADPLDQTLATFSTGPDTLEMNSGDQLTVNMHDTPAGFQVVINDLTTGQTGSMTASIANGFGHPLYQPSSSTCNDQPYAFHPMYGSSSPSTRVLWAAHSYNVAFSDEIGHFEYCNQADSGFPFPCDSTNGYSPNPTDSSPDGDDNFCTTLPLVNVTGTPNFTGCLSELTGDSDFDGPEYQNGTWPGSSGATAGNVATPILFTSPLFTPSGPGPRGPGGPGGPGGPRGKLQNYSQVAFENDLPRIEGATTPPCQRHLSNPADPSPGAGCVDPPAGASFYPIYSTTAGPGNSCWWQEGGGNIPGTTNNFGGIPGLEYGGLQAQTYPDPGPSTGQILETFHNTLSNNPCPAPMK